MKQNAVLSWRTRTEKMNFRLVVANVKMKTTNAPEN